MPLPSPFLTHPSPDRSEHCLHVKHSATWIDGILPLMSGQTLASLKRQKDATRTRNTQEIECHSKAWKQVGKSRLKCLRNLKECLWNCKGSSLDVARASPSATTLPVVEIEKVCLAGRRA